jgi:hypothetical protein
VEAPGVELCASPLRGEDLHKFGVVPLQPVTPERILCMPVWHQIDTN